MLQHKWFLGVAAGVICLLSGCADASEYSIRGQVVDEQGRPIPLIEKNADGSFKAYKGIVLIVRTTARSGTDLGPGFDAKGNFSILGRGAGSYVLRAVVEGYEPQTQTVEVGEGKPAFVKFVLKKS